MNSTKKDKIMEGHRLIRDFQREREKEVDVTNFKWKELEIIKNQLLQNMEDLKEEVMKTDDEDKQREIVEDILILKLYVSKCVDIEKGVNEISEKYGWDK